MNTQTGPYREVETINEDDIKRIIGVVYGGKVLRCAVSYWVALNKLTTAATDTVGILSPHA